MMAPIYLEIKSVSSLSGHTMTLKILILKTLNYSFVIFLRYKSQMLDVLGK